MTPTGNITKVRSIGSFPSIVTTLNPTLNEFLTDLATYGDVAQSDFSKVEEVKALWAVQVKPSSPSGGTSFVVSGETLVYIKAHRYL